jgi:hypothetical protein
MKKSDSKRKMVMFMGKPGQSMEDAMRDFSAKHPDVDLENVPTSTDPSKIFEMTGMTMEELIAQAQNGDKKKPGLFKKIENALFG